MNQTKKLTFSKQFCSRLRIFFIILILLAFIGIALHIFHYFSLKYSTENDSVLPVAIIHAKNSDAHEEIILPGNVKAWHDATIFARTNGYVIKWMKDIGSHVKAGDLLAEISAPEVTAQLHQTEADLKTALANYALAKSTAKRWSTLLKSDSVSKQETDEKISDAKAKAAIVVSTKANRDRLLDLVKYQQVIAPFDGIIMSRTTDVGHLINSGSGTVPLFRLVQPSRLRIYIKVPEYYSTSIKPGLIANLYFKEHPEKVYRATLLDTAKAIDSKTRTLEVQFEMDNTDESLLSGSYTEAHLMLAASTSTITLPVNTLIFRANGLQVASVNSENKVILKPITISRDFGDYVELRSGIKPGEIIILNPIDSITSGQDIKVVWSDTAKSKKA
jgi:RND family efflux transporter MFP subunit